VTTDAPSPAPPPADLPTFDDVTAAARRLVGVAHRTHVATSSTLDARAGASVFLKCENLQRVGAFKIRGAYNALARIPPDRRAFGVLAFSSGNHAQGVALAARLLGLQATVVMPRNAPAPKRAATEGYGARVIDYDPDRETREDIAARLLSEAPPGQAPTLVPPYDHPDVIAGQGSAALEFLDQVGDLDALLVPCGGGGLLSGSALAAKAKAPRCRVIGIEPEVADDATRSFRTKTLQSVKNPPTIADGVRTPYLGRYTFPLVLAQVDDMATVSEEAIREATRFLFERVKLVVEPSGALGVAALLSGSVRVQGRVGVILSGGNVDPDVFVSILTGNAT
jgi:threonine dehydratase